MWFAALAYLAATVSCSRLLLNDSFLQGSFLQKLSPRDPSYWLPLNPDGSDARLPSRKRIERIPAEAWKCLFHPDARTQSDDFRDHWNAMKAPDVLDAASPYYEALDKEFATWDGDEAALSVDSGDPHAQTKWTTFKRCFQINDGGNSCGDCRRAIDAILLIRRAFMTRTLTLAGGSRADFPHAEVWIVGMGPGGLLAAVELALMGHKVAIVERRYAPVGFHRARSTGIFRHTERVLSALGAPRYFSSNVFLYKHKRSVIFPSFQDYLKLIAVKIGVNLFLDCEATVSSDHLIVGDVSDGECKVLTSNTALDLPGRTLISTDELKVELDSVYLVDSTGSGKPLTGKLLAERGFAGARKDMTEVARDLVCGTGSDGSNAPVSRFFAQQWVSRSQGARIETHSNLPRASVNSAFDAASAHGDLDQAWSAFSEDLCRDVSKIISVSGAAEFKQVSEYVYPKSSFWYGIRGDVQAYFAFVFNIDREPFNASVWNPLRSADLQAVAPATTYGGGGKSMVEAIPNSVWIPTPNDLDLIEDVLHNDTPEAQHISPRSWARYHFEGTLIPTPLRGDSSAAAMVRELLNKVFQPGKCSLVKSKHFLFEAVSALFGFDPENEMAQSARESFFGYFERNSAEPNTAAQSASLFPIGFKSLPFGSDTDGLVTTGHDRRSFVIGDAAMPAWFRFGIGIDDAKYGARTVVACVSLPQEQCEMLLQAHEKELSQRALQVYFNLWYNSIWTHAGEEDSGERLNRMIFNLAHRACAQKETWDNSGEFTGKKCPPKSEGFLIAEDWNSDGVSKEEKMTDQLVGCRRWEFRQRLNRVS